MQTTCSPRPALTTTNYYPKALPDDRTIASHHQEGHYLVDKLDYMTPRIRVHVRLVEPLPYRQKAKQMAELG